MRARDVMSREVRVASPEMSIRVAAQIMADLNVGALPVSDTGQLVGMISDRDIIVRAVARGLDGDTPVAGIMTTGAMHCHQDDELSLVLARMEDAQVRRLPVIDSTGALVGLLTLGDLAREGLAHEAAGARRDV